ncbi:MAG: DUF4349 domain-containing protein [Ignavibacteriae bacterium]|nr:DUF4349 domain-containing protein [Ignavibacteriota bacterium]
MKTILIFCSFSLFVIFMCFGCGDKVNVIETSKPNNQTPPENLVQKQISPEKYFEYSSNAPVTREIESPSKSNRKADEKIPDVKDQRLIIRTGILDVEVDKYDEYGNNIFSILKKYNGYIVNNKTTQSINESKSGTIVMKFPSEIFDELIFEVSKIGKVLNLNVQATDVTDEFIDLVAREKTQKELEHRILQLLNNKSSKLLDVFEIEEKLASVRQKIESIDGKIKLMKAQSSYSTLTLNIKEQTLKTPTIAQGGILYELKQAFKNGLSGLTKIVVFLVTVSISVFPVIVIALAIYWIIRKYKARKGLLIKSEK